MNNAVAYLDESTAGWERTLYAFLAEKQRRSGSLRTVQSYSRMLNDFFGRTGKTPDEVTTQDAFAWAYGTGLSGKLPGSITIGARLACLSSFYRFLIRMKVVAANPCDAIERPRVIVGSPRGLSGAQIQGSWPSFLARGRLPGKRRRHARQAVGELCKSTRDFLMVLLPRSPIRQQKVVAALIA